MSRRPSLVRSATRLMTSTLGAVTAATLQARQKLRAHPKRGISVLAICLALVVLVMTSTLPIALAPLAPQLALMLSPNNPDALLAKANRIRADGLATMDEKERSDSGSDAWRDEVKAIAWRVIAVDPLNAAAYMLLADTVTDPAQRLDFLREAMRRSRRQSAATLALMQQSAKSGNFSALIDYADILLRTRPEIGGSVLAVLTPLAEIPEARPALIQWIIRSPFWRPFFFKQLNTSVTAVDTPAQLMQTLAERGYPPKTNEINQYISAILAWKLPDYAYNIWLQSIPAEILGTVDLLNDANFDQAPGSGPFDWRMAAAANSVGEFTTLPEVAHGRVFHVMFGGGRVEFPEISQTLVLAPGRYELKSQARGSVIGKRGLLWGIDCLYGKKAPIGRSEPLLGQITNWTDHAFQFVVPDTPDCAAQTLRFYHDSRFASEQLIDGEIWLAHLRLRRIDDSAQQEAAP